MSDSIVAFVMIAVMLLPFIVRLVPMGPRTYPRVKPGEAESEAQVIMLGTYRIYTYLAVLAVIPTAYRLATGENLMVPSGWYQWIDMVLLGLRVVLAWSLYWRLGYGGRRWLFILGQISGLFCLAEAFWPLRMDINLYLQRSVKESEPVA
ncbi:MAG: hypothetical protein K0R39_3945 [Symbiobacteriaceae bacterium]|jgi:hypothetical protein|nr:hypothetical protein [Symbiobacteriaceae bacterium]